MKDAVSVANNACWAIGELAIKVSAYFYTIWFNLHFAAVKVETVWHGFPRGMSLIKLQCTGPTAELILLCALSNVFDIQVLIGIL